MPGTGDMAQLVFKRAAKASSGASLDARALRTLLALDGKRMNFFHPIQVIESKVNPLSGETRQANTIALAGGFVFMAAVIRVGFSGRAQADRQTAGH